jgi:hydrogenase nickel incorporation protein HypA/HybF
MHELSIAMSLLSMIEEQTEARGGVQVNAVHLKLGPLSGVVKKALQSAYEMACEGTPLQECKLIIEDVAITAHCPKCDQLRKIDSMQEICCPVCRTPTPQIVTGKELEVTALEICS